MLDQREAVIRQHVTRIKRRIMRFRTITMPTQIRHDHTNPTASNFRRMPITHPVHHPRRKVPMNEHERPPRPHLTISELEPITATEAMNGEVRCVACHKKESPESVRIKGPFRGLAQ